MVRVFESGKTIQFVASRLTSANKLAKRGGHVVMEYNDQIFRLHFDNRRVIQESPDFHEGMLDSKPVTKASDALIMRDIGKIGKNSVFHKNTSIANKVSKYSSYAEVCERVFLKWIFCDSHNSNVFRSHSEILEFFRSYNKNTKVNLNTIGIIKHRYSNTRFTKHQVFKDENSLKFVNYIKTKFPEFNEVDFFK